MKTAFLKINEKKMPNQSLLQVDCHDDVTFVKQTRSPKCRLQIMYHQRQDKRLGAVQLPIYHSTKLLSRKKYVGQCTLILRSQRYMFASHQPYASKKLAEHAAAAVAIEYLLALDLTKKHQEQKIERVILFDAENFPAPRPHMVSQASNVLFIFFDSRTEPLRKKYEGYTNCQIITTSITGKDASDIHLCYSARLLQIEYKDACFAVATKDHFGGTLVHLMQSHQINEKKPIWIKEYEDVEKFIQF